MSIIGSFLNSVNRTVRDLAVSENSQGSNADRKNSTLSMFQKTIGEISDSISNLKDDLNIKKDNAQVQNGEEASVAKKDVMRDGVSKEDPSVKAEKVDVSEEVINDKMEKMEKEISDEEMELSKASEASAVSATLEELEGDEFKLTIEIPGLDVVEMTGTLEELEAIIAGIEEYYSQDDTEAAALLKGLEEIKEQIALLTINKTDIETTAKDSTQKTDGLKTILTSDLEPETKVAEVSRGDEEKIDVSELMRRLKNLEKSNAGKSLEELFDKGVKQQMARGQLIIEHPEGEMDLLSRFRLNSLSTNSPGGELFAELSGTRTDVVNSLLSSDQGRGEFNLNSGSTAQAMTNLNAEERTALFDRLSRSVQFQMRTGSGSIKIKLVPENLGSLKIELQVVKEGVKVVLLTDTPKAQGAVQGELNNLRQALEQQGLNIQEIEVGVDPEAHQHQQQEMYDEGEEDQNNENQPLFNETLEEVVAEIEI